ncbi:MAG: glycosyltransferase, partial [Mycobacterium sp.]
YGTANRELKAALARRGAQYCATADLQLHLCFPKVYRPREGTTSVLFTMFESREYAALRDVFAPAFRRADLICTPSSWCRDLFRDWTDKPIRVVPLGIDPGLFPYRRRRWGTHRGTPFRLLFVGAPNPRKWTILPELYRAAIEPLAGMMQLYIKTTGAKVSPEIFEGFGESFTWNRDEHGSVLHGLVDGHETITIDMRLLPRERVPEIYYGAQAGILPHCGEGWGQTAHEAMATGLPLIVSDHSGTREFAKRGRAYLVPTHDTPIGRGLDGVQLLPWPDLSVAESLLAEIVANYGRATTVARRGSQAAHALSWDNAAAALARVLRSVV